MKLLLNGPFTLTATQRADLLATAPGLEIEVESAPFPDALAGRGVTIYMGETVPRNLERWGDLRWVQLLSAGTNQLENHPILRTAIPVTTASGTHTVPIAQFVTCTWLMLAHRMTRLLGFKETRLWPDRLSLACFPVRGLTAGIVGYGSIGRECARQLDALGMKIVCMKRDPANRADRGYTAWPGTGDPEGRLPQVLYSPAELHQMLPRCDLIVVATPKTSATEGMIGENEFALLKRSAHLIVISRGGVVVEDALAAALREGRLAGAVVDCYAQEPVSAGHAFFETPNLILTPHMSGVFENFWPTMIDLLCVNLRRFADGRPLLNQANGTLGY